MMSAAEIAAAKVLPPPAVRRALRLAAGLSARELAEVVGVSRSAIYGWESGRRSPYGPHRVTYSLALADLKRFLAEDDG